MSDSKIFLDKRSKSTYVRRRRWDKEAGKMQQETLHKYDSFSVPPSELPDDVILSESELKQYKEIVEKEVAEQEESRAKGAISIIKSYLQRAVKATESVDSVSHMKIEELETIAELAGKLKVQVNKQQKQT
nr:hypothetical protein [Vibrio parahaemolyticus]